MIRPCNITLNDCPGADAPILNLSSEAPDPLMFAGIGWDPYDPYRPPPLGTVYTATDCSNVTWSADSQAMADLLAKQNAILCAPPGPGFPPFPPLPPFPVFPPIEPFTWTPPTFTPPAPPTFQQFTNTAQTATASCPDGSVFSFTVAAGTLVSAPIDPSLGPVMVDILNAQALAFALAQVWTLRVCMDVPNIFLRPPFPPDPPPDWPPGVVWPPASTDPNVPPPNWPPNRPWPPPSSKGPTLASNPGWCCLGSDLDPALNTYDVSGTGTYTFSITGAVPPGTSLVTSGARSAQLVGTPSFPGQYNYTVHAVKVGNPTISVQTSDTLNVFGMVTASLPDGTVGSPYGPVQLTTAGGTDPVTFSLLGSLPDGLTLSTDGIISGLPTAAGTFDFTVKFTDAENGTCQQDLSIDVTGVDTTCFLNADTLDSGQRGMVYSVTLTPAFAPDPGMNFVFTVVSGALPAGLSLNPNTGEISGTIDSGILPGSNPFCVELTQVPSGGGGS